MRSLRLHHLVRPACLEQAGCIMPSITLEVNLSGRALHNNPASCLPTACAGLIWCPEPSYRLRKCTFNTDAGNPRSNLLRKDDRLRTAAPLQLFVASTSCSDGVTASRSWMVPVAVRCQRVAATAGPTIQVHRFFAMSATSKPLPLLVIPSFCAT
jgi:hypothetical protein